MENSRIATTKLLFRNAFLKLLKEKSMADIRVNELCELAGVNRSTFYRHYDNVSDLMDELIDEVFNMSLMTSSRSMSDPKNTVNYINDTLMFFRDHREYDPLISSASFTMDILAQKLEEEMIRSLPVKNSRYPAYLIRYLVSGSYGIIRKWITNGRREDVREISDMILTYSSGVVK